METRSIPFSRYITVLGSVLLLSLLYLTSLYSYLLFHSLAEIFSIVVACSIFMLVWNSRHFLGNNYLMFIGIAYLFIGGLDAAHTLSYKGMGVFRIYGTNLSTQIWIAARYLESLSLLVAFFFINRKLRINLVLFGYIAVFPLLLTSIFYWKIFPVCFVEGIGLTPFKKISEYIISLIFLASIVLLIRKRREFDTGVFQLLVASIGVTIASEVAFTLYIHAYGIPNLIGHFLKITSFYLIYRAIIGTGLVKPYNLLFRNLKQSEEALQRYASELERRNEEIKQFAYIVSHDLRAPLITIRGFADEFRSTLEVFYPAMDAISAHLNEEQRQAIITALQEDIPEALEFIDSSVTRMDNLINALLRLSRLGHRELKLELIDMNVLVETSLKTLAHRIDQHQVKVTVDSLPEVIADRVSMEQITGNLLTNAVTYLDPERPGKVEITGGREQDETIFHIRDNGRGIAEEDMGKIFAPFRRAGKSEVPGEGMGLAYVQALVQRHGGRIWCESELGTGTSFFFTISNKLSEEGNHA